MQGMTTTEEAGTEIRQLKSDEELRIVVAVSGDYGRLWYRDSYSKKEFSSEVDFADGLYRSSSFLVEDLVANSWEELLAAVAKQRHALGKVSVAFTGRGTVNSFEV